jgi:hypothetical protein
MEKEEVRKILFVFYFNWITSSCTANRLMTTKRGCFRLPASLFLNEYLIVSRSLNNLSTNCSNTPK